MMLPCLASHVFFLQLQCRDETLIAQTLLIPKTFPQMCPATIVKC